MLYYLFDYLAQFNSGFDVFHYLTLRIILSALTALVLSLILGPIIINYLNFKVDNPISANITAIIQNLITMVDSAQPLFSK